MPQNRTTPLQQVEEGMTVNEDIVDRSGRLLIKAGTCLSAKHLRMLKMWGVLEIPLVQAPETSPESAKSLHPDSHQEKQLLASFHNTDLNHPFIKELFRLCLERRHEETPQ